VLPPTSTDLVHDVPNAMMAIAANNANFFIFKLFRISLLFDC